MLISKVKLFTSLELVLDSRASVAVALPNRRFDLPGLLLARDVLGGAGWG